MRLYLVQHGEAKPKETDPDRHLTDRGAKDVAKVAAFVKTLSLKLDVVWQSGKTRAAETADILASALDVAQGAVEHDGLAPKNPVAPVKKELSKMSGDLMIVGHMPFMSRLASLLVARDQEARVVQFHNGGIVCLTCSEEDDWSVEWIVIPQML